MTYYIYILECQNNSLYTGYTTDMQRRWLEHLDGSAKCKYTRSFPPRRVAIAWQMDGSLSAALKLERQIKGLSRQQKLLLIQEPARICVLLPEQATFTIQVNKRY